MKFLPTLLPVVGAVLVGRNNCAPRMAPAIRALHTDSLGIHPRRDWGLELHLAERIPEFHGQMTGFDHDWDEPAEVRDKFKKCCVVARAWLQLKFHWRNRDVLPILISGLVGSKCGTLRRTLVRDFQRQPMRGLSDRRVNSTRAVQR